ncbi:uncharacterized protein LOC111377872 isoform X3 [Olea europaea var. sylvestris]|uniref:uncharacterized protein LOC111377872 isoform X3 n=1 Tax=Olea europaea var. sylvestris TaxID=158386 RepID=UPI000C1CEE0F|nr:uncharacterized protein LOC111377872 isoform X3 [Olea europaea var. sylvestris]
MKNMENGEGNIESKFAGMVVSDTNNINSTDGLFQVMKAVEAAEATIKQQVEENNRLRFEVEKKIQELEKYKSGYLKSQVPHSVDLWDVHVNDPRRVHQLFLGSENQIDGNGEIELNSVHDLSETAVLQKDLIRKDMDGTMHAHLVNQFENGKLNGSLKVLPGGQLASDNSCFSQSLSPSTTFSPSRYQIQEEWCSASRKGLISIEDVNNTNSPKQNVVAKVQEHEEEILQLKKHLAEFSMKESQIRNEKYVLEKRIAYMRLAFDQQHQDLVNAASKAISYRQDLMEENVRLTYALQAAQQERSMFVSSLMPLLAEYSLQPPLADAQSIVSNIKVLFRHLHEQLLVTEAKLKESQYQLAPWRSEVNPSSFPQSLSHPKMKIGLELAPQPVYSNRKITSSAPHTTMDRDLMGHHQRALGDAVTKNSEPDDLGRYSPLSSSNIAFQVAPAQLAVNQDDLLYMYNIEETVSKKVTLGDLVGQNDMDDPDTEGNQNDREPSVNWISETPHTTSLDDPNSYSFSEAADDDPLPAIEGLQILGEAFPGQELQACGYSINGTTSCNFEWVRHLEDGSFNHIDEQPIYLVTADDVDAYLAIEVQPQDDRKRKVLSLSLFPPPLSLCVCARDHVWMYHMCS